MEREYNDLHLSVCRLTNEIEKLKMEGNSFTKTMKVNFKPAYHVCKQDDGHKFIIDGQPRYFRGTIAYVSADNLGAQFIGGFKQGSKPHRKCRVCMGTEEEITNHVSDLIVIA